jgi:hypothetical protein
MRNTKTKIKFTDIAGMLNRDEMREIVGGCGEFSGSGSAAWMGNGGGSSFASIMGMGFGGQLSYGGVSASSSGVSSSSSTQLVGLTITDPVQIKQYIANLINQYNTKGYYDLTDPNLTKYNTQGYTYDPNIAWNPSVPGMISGTLGELTIIKYKGKDITMNAFASQLINTDFENTYGISKLWNNTNYSGGVLPITSHGSVYKPTALEAAFMSKAVYGDPVTSENLNGWSISHAADGKGIKFNGINGFKSQLFEKTLPNGSKEYCYVTAGTEPKDAGDYAANVLQLLGASQQYTDSVNNAKALAALFGGAISFAGHSLGGGLAEANAIATGASALTYNAAGLSILTTGFSRSSNTDAYVMINDPLNALQQSKYLPSAGGNVHYLYHGGTIWGGHSINTVIDALGGKP